LQYISRIFKYFLAIFFFSLLILSRYSYSFPDLIPTHSQFAETEFETVYPIIHLFRFIYFILSRFMDDLKGMGVLSNGKLCLLNRLVFFSLFNFIYVFNFLPLFYFILFYFILFYFILFYFILIIKHNIPVCIIIQHVILLQYAPLSQNYEITPEMVKREIVKNCTAQQKLPCACKLT
jgi:hypothetical protein